MSENLQNNKITCIACAVFRNELDEVFAQNEINLNIKYLDSMLHMTPELLCNTLEKEITFEKDSGNKILLVYGECHNHMDNFEGDKYIKRVSGKNCIEILLGEERYKRLEQDGAFFFLHEWINKWKEIFEDKLGLKGKIAKEFMTEMHKYLLYIDTGAYDVPEKIMNEISSYFALPWKTLKIDKKTFTDTILKTLTELER